MRLPACLVFSIAAIALSLASGAVQAAWPERPVTLIVP
jgi:tripartite-type tricarboxylate transporter receptor subunit TctC